MKFSQPQTLKQVASIINCNYVGADNFSVLGLNEIHVVEPGDIVFVDHPKYYDKALNSAATVVLIDKNIECPAGKALLISDNPFTDYNKLIQYYKPFVPASATIAVSAKIGEGTVIQPNVFVGNDVTIGNNCVIHANVAINDGCIIGNNTIIHSGCVIGGDAFYYKKRADHYEKLNSCGNVIIEDDVEIGACCTIDRGVTSSTIIKKGSKLDSQVQVGHDTIIGECCLIASQTGISGCVVIEDEVKLWGQVGVISGITIGKGAIVLAQSGIGKSLEGGKTYLGSPASESREKIREMVALKQLIKD